LLRTGSRHIRFAEGSFRYVETEPIQVQRFLSGIDYPANRDELVEHARKQGADDAVLDGLSKLPDRSFDGPNAVSEEYSKN
jgi:hypothetical protein